MRDPRDYAGRPCRAELIAVVITGIIHITLEVSVDGLRGAAETLNRPQQVFNLAACGGWLLYICWRAWRSPGAMAAWGFHRQHFRAALGWSLAFAGPATLALVCYGWRVGHLPIPATFWLVLVLYPLWGIAQQFGLQALVTRNLRGLVPGVGWCALAAAILFSAAHFPNAWLMALVFPAGVAFALIFQKHPNIWAIGIVHGLLGSLAYYLVLGQDPGTELLQLLNGSG